MKPVVVDDMLFNWATPTQKTYLQAIKDHGGMRQAARALGVHFTSVHGAYHSAKARAAVQGYAPEHGLTHPAPSPFIVKGSSTLYDEDGKPRLQWVKTSIDGQRKEEAIKEWIEWLAKEVKGLSPIVKEPAHAERDLLSVYPIGDPHFGMYAWEAEAGDDFDTDIAEKVTNGAMDRLVDSAPNSETAIIIPLGDVMHQNDQTNQTPGHKNQLDVDSRYPKVLLSAVRTLRRLTLRALEKHKRVIVRIEPGNHDPQAKWAITIGLSAYFDNNPRVEVDMSPAKFWFHRFGKVLIGSTHGDTAKHEILPGVMAADRAEDWGQTKFRYWYTGHVHHQAVREFPGVVCESFRTLAPKDAWAAGRGYRAGRDMYVIVHHKDFGEIERHRCDIAMLGVNK